MLLRDAATGPNQILLVLDQQDRTPFPTPRSKDVQQYDFVFHQRTQCAGGSTHSLGGRAATPTSRPLHATDRLQTHAFDALTYRDNVTTHGTSRSGRSLQTLESRLSRYEGSLARSGAIAPLHSSRCRTRLVHRLEGRLPQTMRCRRLLYLSKKHVPVLTRSGQTYSRTGIYVPLEAWQILAARRCGWPRHRSRSCSSASPLTYLPF